MIIKDLVGNSLAVGDIVVLKPETVIVGQIRKIESGEIARGVSLAGDKPQGELSPPMIVIEVAMTSLAIPHPNGVVPSVVKVVKPVQEKPVVEE